MRTGTAPGISAGTSVETDGLLHRIFERQASLSPTAPAVEFAGKVSSYAELDEQANRLANLLLAQGVRPGDCVGLLLPRSAEVYAALLAILKTGAAYVPLDPDYPPERISFILQDCRAAALLTHSTVAAKSFHGGWNGRVLQLDALTSELAACSCAAPDAPPPSPQDLCYIIYTSGTTGRPKGVAIEHRSVCHLVEAERELFQVRPSDRVYQGFSIAFDASVEEVWLAFASGATLVGGTEEMVHAGPGLSERLTQTGITVLSCVPTLLAMMEQDVPALRLLILGGEVCPRELVRRWWKPHRKVFNTYGPTEATVIATYAECFPDRPVTIGRPLPDRLACVVDENLLPLSDGASGELCLGGAGLARGYLGRPELNREKFIMLANGGGRSERFYRTGDLVRWTPTGELEFLGRIDGQVKLRGFRVELGEIEAVLLEMPWVKGVAVALREEIPGLQQLVAYVVPRSGQPADFASLRSKLRARLPAYMMPALFEVLPELPCLPSGKVDRKRLPPPSSQAAASARAAVPPRTRIERELFQAWGKLFSPAPISVTDDFFLDLGGHSLLAARLVSELRRTPVFQSISMLDIYRHPSIEALAKRFKPSSGERVSQPVQKPSSPPSENSSMPGTNRKSKIENQKSLALRHFLCGLAQLFSLVFILSFFALQWLAPYLTYTVLVEEEFDFVPALLGAFASLIVFYPVMIFVPIAVKWLVIGRYRPGAYPLWGVYYFRWWFVSTIEAAVPVSYLCGTPLLNLYLQLMGARVGRGVCLQSDSFAIYDLVSIEDRASINANANLLGYTVEGGLLKLGRITVGKDCFVGANASLGLDTVMQDGAALEDLSLLPRGQTIPAGETWRGSPAAPQSQPRAAGSSQPAECMPVPNRLGAFWFGLLHALGLLIFPVLVVAALFPGIILMNRLNYLDPYYWYLLLSPLVGVSFVLLLALEIATIKWLLLGKVQPGRNSLQSWYYVRKWFVDQTMDLSLDILGPLYASVYLGPWYRLLGARFGRDAEVSTASFISPDLLSIGDESFIADSVSLGAPRCRNGMMTLGRNHIGRRSFIGNSALLPPETFVGDDVLIGCLSVPPDRPEDAVRPDSAWLGSPAVFLPHRQKDSAFADTATFHPTPALRAVRAMIEFVRVITPATCFIILLSLLFSALLLLHDVFSLSQTLLFFPALYLGCGLAATVFTIAAKWVLVGKYRAGERPLWSTFVWRNELINALHEHLAEPFFVGALTGTPFLSWYFRLLGARIGRRVYLETTDFSEFDLADIRDEAALNADCTVQTHLFEDRVMKMSTVSIGPQCAVGAGSLVLYDTRMEAGSSLGPLSLLMKGEVLPVGTNWEGIPARSSPPVA